MSKRTTPRPFPDALRRAESLPCLPPAAARILALWRGEETSIADLAQALSDDLDLTARILRFANSSLGEFGPEVTSLRQAEALLGAKGTALLALSFSLAPALPREGRTHRLDHALFWRRSLAGAVAGRALARLAGTGLEEEAFLGGLLGEIGQLVLARCLAREYETVLAETGDRDPTPGEEWELLGFHRGHVAGVLLRSWGLPPLVCAAIEQRHRPADAPPDARVLAQILHLAFLTVGLLCAESKDDALVTLEEGAREYFGLPPEVVYSFLTALEPGIEETAAILHPSGDSGPGHGGVHVGAKGPPGAAGPSPPPPPLDARASEIPPHRLCLRANPARRDPLTGLPDRLAGTRFLEEELAFRAIGGKHPPLGLLLLRLDGEEHLRRVHGDAAADHWLKCAGEALGRLVRRGDLPLRRGRDEFAVILSEASPYALRVLARRLLDGIEKAAASAPEAAPSVTVAGACAAGVTSAREGRGLFDVVRRLLDRARRSGPGTVEIRDEVLEAGEDPDLLA